MLLFCEGGKKVPQAERRHSRRIHVLSHASAVGTMTNAIQTEPVKRKKESFKIQSWFQRFKCRIEMSCEHL